MWRTVVAAGWPYDPLVGQPPGQKAARAASGQQFGKAQREAVTKAQAAAKQKAAGKQKGLAKKAAAAAARKTAAGKTAVKKTAGKKAVAKKTVPLPRGSPSGRVPGHLSGVLQGLRQGRGHHEGDRRLGTPGLRAPADVGSRAGVRQEQGPDRER